MLTTCCSHKNTYGIKEHIHVPLREQVNAFKLPIIEKLTLHLGLQKQTVLQGNIILRVIHSFHFGLAITAIVW
ncbi:hypothetical protein Syun_027999 [Stephania yunnanensis]|uniref:Uncharacterized protein n=1 Tax=Stephania yunnanensis TaxID=152371 RepID=A0AAP0HLI9_9MAGN